MKLLIILLIALFCQDSLGQTCQEVTKPNAKKIQKAPTKAKAVPVEKATTDQLSTNSATNSSNQTVNVTVTQRSLPERVTERLRLVPVYKTAPVRENHLLLLVGQSKTKAVASQDNCCSVSVNTVKEPDVGLLYVHDFGHVSGALMGTVNQNYYVGLGVNF